jgi:DME family drug/metabolite transporter
VSQGPGAQPIADAGSFHRRGAALIAGAALLWSTGGLFIKLAPMPGLAVAGARALITVLFYLIVLRPKLSHARWSTAIAYAGMILTFVTATKLTSAANAIFLQYTGPAYVLLLSPWLLKEPMRRRDVLPIVLSLLGLSLFFVGKMEPGHALGNALGAVSGLFFGLSVLFLRRDAKTGEGDAIPSTTLGNGLAALIAIPLSLGALHTAFTAPSPAPLLALGGLLWLGVVQMGVAYLLFARGLKRVPAAEASLVSMLEPLLSPLWVFLGTGERPTAWALAGGAVVLGSVLLRTLGDREPG